MHLSFLSPLSSHTHSESSFTHLEGRLTVFSQILIHSTLLYFHWLPHASLQSTVRLSVIKHTDRILLEFSHVSNGV